MTAGLTIATPHPGAEADSPSAHPAGVGDRGGRAERLARRRHEESPRSPHRPQKQNTPPAQRDERSGPTGCRTEGILP